jgi:putative tricarboxylic transport membrane protein
MPLLSAFQEILSSSAILWLTLGVLAEISVGAIPGMGGGMLMAICIPLTFSMTPLSAVLLLMGIYVGAVSGGLISATLLKMPGTPSSIMTTFDGHPMAVGGEPGRALSLGINSSLVGGVIAGIILVLVAPALSVFALKIGPWEEFSIIVMAMVLIAAIGQGNMMAALFSGALGMCATLPGKNPASGELRYTLGFENLNEGFSLLSVLLGVFVMSQVIEDVLSINEKRTQINLKSSSLSFGFREWKKHWLNLLRSSCIGTWVGILPGVGASISSMVSYGVAKAFSKTPQKFGTGHDEGIVASEAANNANVGGALVPLITLGIPGAPDSAILLGAMIIHNVQPGPLLFQNNANLVWGLMAGYLLAVVIMYVVMMLTVRRMVRIINIPRTYLIPTVFVFCVIGAYVFNYRIFDVWVFWGFGLLGFGLRYLDIPLGPFVIGFILANKFETQLYSGLQSSGGSFVPLLTHPIALVFLIISACMLAYSFMFSSTRTTKQISSEMSSPDM